MESLNKLKDLEKLAYDLHFRWPNEGMILSQISSELEEVRSELEPFKDGDPASQERLQYEVGDLILATFSLCSFFGLDVNQTIDKAVDKFEGRLKKLKELLEADGINNLQGKDLSTLLNYWKNAKL